MMAVSQMKSISIIGLMRDLDKAVDVCGHSGVFHPDDAASFYSDTEKFIPINEKNPYAQPLSDMTDLLNMANMDITLLDSIGSDITYKEIDEYCHYLSNTLGQLIISRGEIEQEIDNCKRSINETSHFMGFELAMDKISNCKYIKANFGRLPKESLDKLNQYEDNPYVMFFPCTKDDTHYWGVYISPVDHTEEVDRIFSGLFFEHYEISNLKGTPEQYNKELKEKLIKLEARNAEINTQIADYKLEQKERCTKYYSKLTEYDTIFKIKNHVIRYHKSFIFVGWVPAECADQLLNQLGKIGSIECSLDDGTSRLKQSPPIKLKNNWFAKPYEFYVDMFGLPNYNEIDPSTFLAITYTILFGIMFGDLGQGLVVIIAGICMWKLKKMALGKILIPCGISSAIFGTLYGSFFGFENALDPFYKAVFNLSEKPVDVMDANTTNYIIYLSVAIGFVLVAIAMLLNIYTSFRQRDKENAIFGASGIAGFVFYIALCFGLVSDMLLGTHLMTAPYIICLVIIPLLLIFLKEPLGKLVCGVKEWQPESWGEYCAQSFFELFETLLSYVTNTMSFLRVGAFVLVHAGMMLVVFTLADMSSGIAFWLIVAFGNALVICMEALIVGIQVLRLEFYEMFSRFYKGEGRPFDPIRVKPGKKQI